MKGAPWEALTIRSFWDGYYDAGNESLAIMRLLKDGDLLSQSRTEACATSCQRCELWVAWVRNRSWWGWGVLRGAQNNDVRAGLLVGEGLELNSLDFHRYEGSKNVLGVSGIVGIRIGRVRMGGGWVRRLVVRFAEMRSGGVVGRQAPLLALYIATTHPAFPWRRSWGPIYPSLVRSCRKTCNPIIGCATNERHVGQPSRHVLREGCELKRYDAWSRLHLTSTIHSVQKLAL
jgi:hypothetical protein